MALVNDNTQCERCGYTRASHRKAGGDYECPAGHFIPKDTLIPESRIREYLPDCHAQLDVAESLQILGRLFDEVGECHSILSHSSVKEWRSVGIPGRDPLNTHGEGASIASRVRGFASRAEQLQGLVEEYERSRRDPHRALRVLQEFVGPKEGV